MIVVVYALVSELSFPVIYNYWAIMALDIYQLIIWLVAMAVTASDISDINKALDLFNYDGGDYGGYGDYGNGGSGSSDGGQYCYDGYCVSYKQKRSGVPFDGNFGKLDTEDKGKTYRGIVAAIAGISGLQMYVPHHRPGTITLTCITQDPLWCHPCIRCARPPGPSPSRRPLPARFCCCLSRTQDCR